MTGTALELDTWLEQKMALKKLFIQKYGSKRALKRPLLWRIRRTLRDIRRAHAADPLDARRVVHQYYGRCQRASLHKPPKHPKIKNQVIFGPILAPPRERPQKMASRGVRVWAPFEAILSDPSDPRRFRSVWDIIYRFKSSDVASDDFSDISRDLARFEPHLASQEHLDALQSISAGVSGACGAIRQVISII